MGTPKKRCPKCGTVFEGDAVAKLYSCDCCGNGYLSNVPTPETGEVGLPRGGGETQFHTRDDY